MTRAKDDLHLLVPQRFFVHGQASKGDRPLYASRTRFITEALLPNFEKITWPVVSATRSSTSGQAAQMDVHAHMRRYEALPATRLAVRVRDVVEQEPKVQCN
jgi:DNA helicase-2/ATP-dependent DNA helicase PcrA